MNIGTVWDEIGARLEALNKKESFFRESRVALYGTGLNAQRILDNTNISVVAMVDQSKTGTVFYGKKVLSLLELLEIGIDTIIIATEPDISEIVYERIAVFCFSNKIQIFDMYGNDMQKMHAQRIESSILSETYAKEDLLKEIKDKKVLFIALNECLCERLVDDEKLYRIIAEKLKELSVDIPDFERLRKRAMEVIPKGGGRQLSDIYEVLSTYRIAKEELQIAQGIEKKCLLDNICAREEILGVLRRVMKEQNLDVYIMSNIYVGSDVLRTYIDELGLKKASLVCSDEKNFTVKSIIYLQAACELVGKENVLCIGNKKIVHAAQIVGVPFVTLKGSKDIYKENIIKNLKYEAASSEEANFIVSNYNSPFNISSYKSLIIGAEYEVQRGNIDYLDLIDETNDIESVSFKVESNPKVSIVIPAFNQYEYTKKCLLAIHSHVRNVDYEIIVADDCSTDETKNIEDNFKGIRVVRNKENLMFLKNCNNAAKEAKGEYIVFLNNDTQVQERWLESLVDILDNDPLCGMVGSKLVYPDGTLQEAGGIIWNDGSAWNYGRGNHPDAIEYTYVREVDYISGASIMIRKNLWEEIGGFDERYIPSYCEDSDLAFEVRKHGYTVKYQPESIVVHFEGVTNGTDITTGIKQYQEVNKEKLFEKWKDVLLRENNPNGERVLAAAERKQDKKSILYVSEDVPEYDKDAGSRTLFQFLKLFAEHGYIVKFLTASDIGAEPYNTIMRRMGIQVVAGDYCKEKKKKWIEVNKDEIDFVFLNYPNVSYEYIDFIKKLEIPVRYYGVDLHYFRFNREYELKKENIYLNLSKDYYRKEKYLIENSDIVYYPSQKEVEIVNEEFDVKKVKLLLAFIYPDLLTSNYSANKREGILFVGGFRHAPNVDAVEWFVKNIYPIIKQSLNVDFYIVGSNTTEQIMQMNGNGVNVLGRVSDEELEALYNKVKIVVAPLRYGSGIKGKVIEAMGYGVPIVTTSIGIEGIDQVKSCNMICDNAEDFARKIIEIYNNDKLLNKVSNEEIEIIKRDFSETAVWESIKVDFT